MDQLNVQSPANTIEGWDLAHSHSDSALRRQLQDSPVRVLWVCLPGMSTGSGNRKDRKRLQTIVNLVQLQMSIGGD
eukprot:721948-Heterocapsa_arctica.AAC.1